MRRKDNEFIGRDIEYKNIEDWFFEGKGKKPYAISGPNDIGKTFIVDKVLEYNEDAIATNRVICLKEISLYNICDETQFFELVFECLSEDLEDKATKTAELDLEVDIRSQIDILEAEIERLVTFESGKEYQELLKRYNETAQRISTLTCDENEKIEKELECWEHALNENKKELSKKREELCNLQAILSDKGREYAEENKIWKGLLKKLNSLNADIKKTTEKKLTALWKECKAKQVRVVMPIDEFDYAAVRENYSQNFFGVLDSWKKNIQMVILSRRQLGEIASFINEVKGAKSFSENFTSMVIGGLNNSELDDYFKWRYDVLFDKYNVKLTAEKGEEIRRKIVYYCGRHPGLLTKMYNEMKVWLESSEDANLTVEVIEDISKKIDFERVFERLYKLMEPENELNVNYIEDFLKCFCELDCDEIDDYWFERLAANGYIVRRKNGEDSLAKLFGGETLNTEFPEYNGYEPISPYALQYISDRYRREQKERQAIRDEIQSVVENSMNSEERQELLKEIDQLKETNKNKEESLQNDISALQQKIVGLEKLNGDLIKENKEIAEEWDASENAKKEATDELRKKQEELKKVEEEHAEELKSKEEQIDELNKRMLKGAEEAYEKYGIRIDKSVEEMLEELLKGKAEKPEIDVLLQVIRAYDFETNFENAVRAHYLLAKPFLDAKTDEEKKIADEFDYTSCFSLYFKLYEGILKELHSDIYVSCLPAYETRIKKRNGYYTFGELHNKRALRMEKLTLGAFLTPLDDTSIDAVGKLARTTDASSVEYMMWDKHKNWLGTITGIRNDKASHFKDKTDKVTKQQFVSLRNILFPTTPKREGGNVNDGALMRACDLRSVYDRSEGKANRKKTVKEIREEILQNSL